MLSVAFYFCAEYRRAQFYGAEYRYAEYRYAEFRSAFSVSWTIIRILNWHNLADNGNKFTPENFYENANVILTLFQFLQFTINN
jgi:hypothetical protein